MISYTYKVIRNEGDEKVVYEPKLIPQELPTLSYIEGPNSSGKSTLLNIIALGFKGNQRKGISKALISKMNSLLDSSYQQLSFEVNIKQKDTNLLIKKDLESDQIFIYEINNGERIPIIPELLEEKYNLIYDIPDDPINRLRQLTITISSNQNFVSHRISDFETFIRNQLDLGKKARNPKSIEKLESDIKNKKREYGLIKEDLIKKSEYLDILEQYTYSKFYIEYSLQVESADKEIVDLEKGLKKTNRKIANTYQKEKKLFSEYQIDINDNYDNLTPIIRVVLKEEKHIQNLWDNLEKYLDDIFREFEVSSHVKKITSSVESRLIGIISSNNNKDLVVELDIWSKVIDLLSSLSKKDSIVPGVDKSINEFINILTVERQKNKEIVKKQEVLEEGLNLIQQINKELALLEKVIIPKVKESNNASIQYLDNEESTRHIINKKVTRKDEMLNFKGLYGNECINKGINITNKVELNNAIEKIDLLIDKDEVKKDPEHILLERISQLKNLIKQEKNKIDNLSSFIKIKENELTNMKNKEPYIYQDYIPQINQIYSACNSLNTKFKMDFKKYIDKIINEDSNINLNDAYQMKYYEGIAVYLGKKIDEIMYIDNLYKVSKVDIVNREIITDSKKIIRYDDMGTGQSQSAYFLGKLNSIDNRKVVVLIDEVAMMDRNSLEPIIKRLKKMHKDGQLILGMIVQKAEKVSVIQI